MTKVPLKAANGRTTYLISGRELWLSLAAFFLVGFTYGAALASWWPW